MFYTAKEPDDPPNGRFWPLSPDGDVHPETLLAPAATGLVWLDGRHQHILTTLMVAGHRSVRVYGFGVQRRNVSPKVIVLAVFVRLEAEDTCVEDKTLVVPKGATPLTTPVSPPDRGFDERETLGLGESVAEPPLDERVLSVHEDSAGDAVVDLVQLRWVGVPVSSLRTLLSCCKFMGVYAWYHLVHHRSSFLQLSGLLPTDPAVQEHKFLCRVSRIYLETSHSRRLLRIPLELEELASNVVTVEMVAAKERRRLREKRTGAARRRPEEMTEPGDEGVGVLLAESVQKVERPVSRELLPLPIPFPENEVVESERIRGLSRAVRSRVMRRVGWQGWANAGVRSVNEIFSKTATSEAGGRPSTMQLSSLPRICDAYRGDERCRVQFYRGSLQSALRFSAWLHRNRFQTSYLQGGHRFPARPRREDGRWLCSFNRSGLRESWRDWRRVLLRSPSEFHEVIAREGGGCSSNWPRAQTEASELCQACARYESAWSRFIRGAL